MIFSPIEKRKLLVPWITLIVVNIVWCLIAIILFVASPVTPPTVLVSIRMSKAREKLKHLQFKDFQKSYTSYAWEEIGIYLVSIALSLYCILIVWSFFRRMKRNSESNIVC